MRLRSLMVLPALGLGLACTAILNPRDDVERCGAPTDCSASGDTRYAVTCVFPEGSSLDSTEVDKICVAEFEQPSCDPTSYTSNQDHPLLVLPTALGTSRYTCTEDQQGLQGCPPRVSDGGCGDGLSNRNGICDTPDGDAVNLAGNADLAHQDILDQFCRQFFCDDTFVCDRDGNTCVPCDPDKAFGNGGCGTVYVAGAPSCVYTDVDETCEAPTSDLDDPNFGACM